jgi:hypothetical protein
MSTPERDKFEIYLDEMIEKLQECQKNNNVKSCSDCQHYLKCTLRTEYVSSGYNSMSKGETGGFEF